MKPTKAHHQIAHQKQARRRIGDRPGPSPSRSPICRGPWALPRRYLVPVPDLLKSGTLPRLRPRFAGDGDAPPSPTRIPIEGSAPCSGLSEPAGASLSWCAGAAGAGRRGPVFRKTPRFQYTWFCQPGRLLNRQLSAPSTLSSRAAYFIWLQNSTNALILI